VNTLLSHLGYTIRVLLKSPGFTITTILILGLGIGANTAIFSLINGVLLKPLPYPNADRLVRIFQPTQNIDRMSMAYSDYLDFRASQHSLQDLTVYYPDDFQITGNGDPERIEGAYVSGTFFTVLGRPFLLGQPFGEAEEATAASVVVLSEPLWRTRFHGDPKVIGTSISLSGRSFQVIGVTPAQANETDSLFVTGAARDTNRSGNRIERIATKYAKIAEALYMNRRALDFGEMENPQISQITQIETMDTKRPISDNQ
jgi:putative ABC transport system permease protein